MFIRLYLIFLLYGTNTQWDILSIGLEIQFTVLRFDKMVQGNDFFFGLNNLIPVDVFKSKSYFFKPFKS